MEYIGASFGKAYRKPIRSAVAGNAHEYTEEFDDYISYLSYAKDSIILTELRVIHDTSRVYGVEGRYLVDGHEVHPGGHYGKYVHKHAKNH